MASAADTASAGDPAPAGDTASSRSRHLTAQGEDRRADIVEQAEKLFAEHGYARTRMTDIAEAAGVTKGLLYWYFDNKEALISEILGKTRSRLRKAQAEVVADIDDPLARIFVGTAESVRFILENYRLYLITGDNSRRSLAAKLGESSQVHAKDTAKALEEGQAAGVVRDDIAAQAMAFANAGVVNNLCGAAYYRSVEPQPAEIARTAATYVLRAVAADSSLADAVERDFGNRLP